LPTVAELVVAVNLFFVFFFTRDVVQVGLLV